MIPDLTIEIVAPPAPSYLETMLLSLALDAFAEIFTPPFRRVLYKTLALTALLLVFVFVAAETTLRISSCCPILADDGRDAHRRPRASSSASPSRSRRFPSSSPASSSTSLRQSSKPRSIRSIRARHRRSARMILVAAEIRGVALLSISAPSSCFWCRASMPWFLRRQCLSARPRLFRICGAALSGDRRCRCNAADA